MPLPLPSVLEDDALQGLIIHVKGCSGLMNKSTSHATIMTDPFVVVYDEGNKKVLETSVMENTIAPVWDEGSGAIGVDISGNGNLTLQVWHRGRRRQKEDDQFLGELVVPTATLLEATDGAMKTFPLRARIKEPDARVKVLTTHPEGLGKITIAWRPGELSETQLGKTMSLSSGAVYASMNILGCEGLLKRDPGEFSLSDPYITIRYPENRLRYRSDVMENTLNPTFSQPPIQLRLPTRGVSTVMRIRAWNSNPKPQKDTFLGEALVDVAKLTSTVHKLPLQPRENETDAIIAKLRDRLGFVKFEFQVADPAAEPKAPPPKAPLPTEAALHAAQQQSTFFSPKKKEFDPATYSSAKKIPVVERSVKPKPPIETVPVQLTDVVPLKIVNESGRELVTSIPVTAPLRSIQHQITDYFTLCPSSQVLTYNRNTVDVNLSLEQNGALLLRGEPSVKLMLQTAKGPVVALTCVLPNAHEVPVSVPESASIGDVKRAICSVEGVKYRPEEIRLLWRYNELSDKGTVEYYRLTSKSRVDVVKRPNFNFDNKKKVLPEETRPTSAPKARRVVEQKDLPKYVPASGRGRGTGQRPASATAAGGRAPTTAARGGAAHVSPQKTSIPARPRGFYEDQQLDEENDADLLQLKKTLDNLKQGVHATTRNEAVFGSVADVATIESLRKQLAESQQNHREALDRVAQLEETVARYQNLLRRSAIPK